VKIAAPRCYRLIAKDHDANGGSNGGSSCVFSGPGDMPNLPISLYSDCENSMGEHYKLKAASIKAFLNIANGALPGP